MEPADLFSLQSVQERYSAYAQARAEFPFHRHERLGIWTVARYDDVVHCLRHPAVSSRRLPADALAQESPEAAALARLVSKWFVFEDGAAHLQLRAPFRDLFAGEWVAGWRPIFAQEAMRHWPRASAFDFVAEFALPFTEVALCRMLGVPPALVGTLHGPLRVISQFASVSGAGAPNLSEVGRAAQALEAALPALVEHAGQGEQSAVARYLSQSGSDPGTTMAHLTFLLYTALATTFQALGNAAYLYLSQARAMEASLTDFATEAMRFEPPVQCLSRRMAEDARIGGQLLRKDQTLLLLLASANRDSAAFSRAEEFYPGRSDAGKSLAFGFGAHFCPASRLATIAVEEGLRVLGQSGVSLPAGFSPRWKNNFMYRELQALPVLVSGS